MRRLPLWIVTCLASAACNSTPATSPPPPPPPPPPPVVVDAAEAPAIPPTGMTACDRMFVLYGEVSACTKVPVDATFQAQLVARAKEWITAPPEMRTAIEAACTDSVKELETELATCQRLPPLEPEGA